MQVYLGEKGLGASFQDEFPKTMKCYNCKGRCRIMFVASEMEELTVKEGGEYVYQLHDTTGKKGGLWLHDACAIALYLCPKCFEPNAIINQA